MFVVFLIVLGLIWPVTMLILRSSSGNRLLQSDLEKSFEEMADRIRDLEDDIGDLQENVDRVQDELDFTRRLLESPERSAEKNDGGSA